MVIKIFISLILVFCTLFFAVMSFAADTTADKPAVTDKPSIADKPVTADKPADISHALKGSDPAQGVIIGNPVTEDQMLLNPVKKKKKAQKQEDIKEKK